MYTRRAVDAENVVAYGFLVDEDKQSGVMHNRFIQLFYTATDARRVLSCTTPDVQVLICDKTSEVSPLNLAAALHKDNPLRDIYLEKSEPQGLFVSRMEIAGARGVVSKEEAEKLVTLNFDEQKNTHIDNNNARTIEAAPIDSATPTCDDLAWLEQVLELDELDDIAEISQSTESTVLQQPVRQPRSIVHLPVEPKQEVFVDSEAENSGIVAAFVSGRGGVGKSSLTVLTALDLWLAGSRVVMLDMDLQFGDISVLAGDEPQSRIKKLGIEQICNSRMRMPGIDGSLLLLEAPQNPELAEELVHQIPELLTALRNISDIVLINTSCLWNETAAVLASEADKLVICMDQRATSISAARLVVNLCIRLQIPSTRLYYLLNRCSRNAPITDIDASLAMGGVDISTIAEGGADVDELLSLGCPYELLTAKNPLRQSIQELGKLLLAKPSDGVGYEESARR